MNFHSSHRGSGATDATEPTAAGNDAAPSGRPRLVRDRLMTAAEGLIAERQVTAITARDLARAAGVADGALYNHFDDKHDLILAALLARFGRLVEAFNEEVATVRQADPALPIEIAMDRLVAAAFQLHASVLPMLAHVISEPAMFHRFMVAIHQPPFGGQIFLDPFEEYLAAERAAGSVADVDPAAAADLLMGAILMLALIEVVAGAPAETRETRLHQVVRTLLSGLLPRT